METLVKIENSQEVTNSLLVAEKFNKNHRDVMRSIRDLLSSAQNCAHLFIESSYIDTSNRTYPMYMMNRDGFSLLAMGFTGEKALKFKLDFINFCNILDSYIARR